jgi:phosphoribosylglycinamide formyltransferase-1
MKPPSPIFAVFASGSGSNLQALICAIGDGRVAGRIGLVVSDRPECLALERARAAGLSTYAFRPMDFADRESWDRAATDAVEAAGCSFIVLAGYMRLFSNAFIQHHAGRILNIHPALLPAFPGTHAVRDALAYGVKVTGCSVHFVDEGVDTGPIIAQRAVEVEAGDTVESLTGRLQKEEHRLYPEIVNLFCLGRIRLDGRKVIVTAATARP